MEQLLDDYRNSTEHIIPRLPWLADLLSRMRAGRCYSPYYLPLRWRSLRLLWRLAEAARTGSPLYGKLDWAGYYLLGGRWLRS